MYTDDQLYELFVEKSTGVAEMAAMSDDMMAEQVAEMIGDSDAAGEYPRDDDGMIDLYAIAKAVKRVADRGVLDDVEAEKAEVTG